MDCVVMIAYRPNNGNRAVPVAQTTDRGLLIEVAAQAVREKRVEAEGLAGCDAGLASLATAEADRLEHALSVLIPELRSGANHPKHVFAM